MRASAFTDAERAALAAVLDTLIPPAEDGSRPGAGEIGLADLIEARVPDLHAAVREGVAALDATARERGAADFCALAPEARREPLEALADTEPGFLPGLLFQTIVHYYQDARVLRALGVEARPPHPLGYPLEAGDLSALERVRARGPRYRTP